MSTALSTYRKFIFALAALLVVGSGLIGSLPSASASDFAATCAQYHTVQRGENLYRIGLRYNLSVTTLQNMNGIYDANRIYAGQSLCVKISNPTITYTVQRGDTLSRIARNYGVTLTALAQVNNIYNVNLIYVGQVLRIP
jgi:LysM repeat protein